VALIRLLVNKIRKKEQSFAIVRACVAATLLLLLMNLGIIFVSAMSVTLSLPLATIHGVINCEN